MVSTAVETLRKAAEKLRALAESAEPGPWSAECMGSEGYMVYGPRGESGSAWERRRKVPAQSYRGSHEECRDNAEYIAAMHPAVGLALADWLDHAARYIEVASDDGMFNAETFHSEALAVARAVLGEAS